MHNLTFSTVCNITTNIMKPKIIWLFALVFLITKYSSAEYGYIERQYEIRKLEEFTLGEIEELFTNIQTKLLQVKRRSTNPADGSNVSNNLIYLNSTKPVEELIQKFRDFESYLSREESTGFIQQAATLIYNNGYIDVTNNLAKIDASYHNVSTPFSTLGNNLYIPEDNSVLRNFSAYNLYDLRTTTHKLLEENYRILFKASLIKLREDDFLYSLQNTKGIDECDTCPVKARKLFWLYWPIIKSEIRGYFTYYYANLMRFYTAGIAIDEYRLKDRTENSMWRLKQYYSRLWSCNCRKDRWGYRASNSRVIISNEPRYSWPPIEFRVKGVLNATITIHYQKLLDYIYKIEIRQNSIQVHDKNGIILSESATLNDTNKLYGFRIFSKKSKETIEMMYTDVVNRYAERYDISLTFNITVENAISTSYNKNRDKEQQFFTIASHRLSDWMIKDVDRAQRDDGFIPKKDTYWCPFSGEFPLKSMKVSTHKYVARYARYYWESWVPMQFDETLSRTDWESPTLPDYLGNPTYEISTGCGMEWKQPSKDSILHALVANDDTTEPFGEMFTPLLFICRGLYNGESSRIGRFDGDQCIVNDGEDHIISNYEILVQMKARTLIAID